jgi:hypothetical protein
MERREELGPLRIRGILQSLREFGPVVAEAQDCVVMWAVNLMRRKREVSLIIGAGYLARVVCAGIEIAGQEGPELRILFLKTL